jgi:hypothetical protein
LLLTLFMGCESSGPPTYEVSGTVTWNGALLPDGDIIFQATDDRIVPDAGKIRDGQFRLRAKAGKKRVEIHASRLVTGKDHVVMKTMERKPYIPECYNAQTTLTAEVKADRENRFVFDLKGKP